MNLGNNNFRPHQKSNEIKQNIMKNMINNSWYNLLMVSIIAIFSSMGAVNAQNPAQNKQQIINNSQCFIDKDTNKDGFINKDECQFGSLDEFDTDNNGKLSRNEYINAKHTLNGNIGGNLGLCIKRNRGNCIIAQRGNGVFKNGNCGNAQNRGTGVCPYENQGSYNKNSTRSKAQNIP
jgi:hypothetical protein